MSREVIESIHIASDVVAHLDLTNGRDKGRIYRLAPPGFKPPPQPRLGQATTAELAGCLEHPDGWWRDTASRLIYERQDRSIVELLRRRLVESPSDVGRMHILWALDGLKALDERDLTAALADASPGVREHAVRLAERRLADWPALLDRILPLAADPEPRVRFQVAFTLGETNDPQVDRGAGQHRRARYRRRLDPNGRALVLRRAVRRTDRSARERRCVSGAGGLELVAGATGRDRRRRQAGCEDRAGSRRGGQPAARLARGVGHRRWAWAPACSARAARSKTCGRAPPAARQHLERLLVEAAQTAADEKANSDARIQAVRLLSYGGAARAVDALTGLLLLDPRQSEAVQIAAVGALARYRRSRSRQASDRRPGRVRLRRCKMKSSAALGSRAAWAEQLLDACASRPDHARADSAGNARGAARSIETLRCAIARNSFSAMHRAPAPKRSPATNRPWRCPATWPAAKRSTSGSAWRAIGWANAGFRWDPIWH